MANRNQRKEIAKETLSIQEKGCYQTYDGKSIQIKDDMKHCNINSRVYNDYDFITLSAKPYPKLSSSTKFEVTDEHSISACLRVSSELSTEEKLLCLNFASAKNVCGGMVGGSLAQEESLGLCSSLYSSLSQFSKDYYNVNRKNPKDGLYHNILVYSQDCVVFRNDDDYSLLEYPIKISFISSPAVNKGVAMQRGLKEVDISNAMKERICHVIAVAAENGHKTLILGAWGCGVFRNDPDEIALQFAHFLQEPKGMFCNIFQRIIFAVGKELSKLKAFRKVFSC